MFVADFLEGFMRRLWMIALILALASSLGHTQEATPSMETTPTDDQPTKKINPPKEISNIEGRFSNEARAKNINGRCLISLTVDAYGLPQEIKLVRCSDPSFEKSSLNAVEKYRFSGPNTSRAA
jgi:outer membrane biosynthesis protein TonB